MFSCISSFNHSLFQNLDISPSRQDHRDHIQYVSTYLGILWSRYLSESIGKNYFQNLSMNNFLDILLVIFWFLIFYQ